MGFLLKCKGNRMEGKMEMSECKKEDTMYISSHLCVWSALSRKSNSQIKVIHIDFTVFASWILLGY